MKYPCLVPKRLCKTDISVAIDQEGLNKYGEPLKPVEYSGKCNYQDKAKTVLTAEKKLIEITGAALFPGDICPELPVISGGSAVIFGGKRRILEGRKSRNPDGTVNYTEVYDQCKLHSKDEFSEDPTIDESTGDGFRADR